MGRASCERKCFGVIGQAQEGLAAALTFFIKRSVDTWGRARGKEGCVHRHPPHSPFPGTGPVEETDGDCSQPPLPSSLPQAVEGTPPRSILA